jgi:hypothetical protein
MSGGYSTASFPKRSWSPSSGFNRRAAAPRRPLNGSGNNLDHPNSGRLGTPNMRVAKPDYTDGIGKMVDGPSPRSSMIDALVAAVGRFAAG